MGTIGKALLSQIYRCAGLLLLVVLVAACGGGEKSDVPTILGGYWPSYLFSNQEVGEKVASVSMPIGMGGAGHGGNAHAANEYYVIEGAGKVYGMAGAEKSHAAIFYNFASMGGSAAPRKSE